MPIALAPTEGGIDARGTFTGGVLPSEAGAAIIYTAVTKVDRAHETIRAEGLREVQCIATSTDPDLSNPHDTSALNEWLSQTHIHNRAGEVSCLIRAGEDEWVSEIQQVSSSSAPPIVAIAYAQANEAPCVAIGDKLIPLRHDESGTSTLHVWIDGSVIEVLIDNREAVTVRDYSSPDSGGELRIVWKGPAKPLTRLSISDIEPISPDRLTT